MDVEKCDWSLEWVVGKEAAGAEVNPPKRGHARRRDVYAALEFEN